MYEGAQAEAGETAWARGAGAEGGQKKRVRVRLVDWGQGGGRGQKGRIGGRQGFGRLGGRGAAEGRGFLEEPRVEEADGGAGWIRGRGGRLEGGIRSGPPGFMSRRTRASSGARTRLSGRGIRMAARINFAAGVSGGDARARDVLMLWNRGAAGGGWGRKGEMRRTRQ